MWNDLDEIWKVIFELSWESFCKRSFPIGAAVVNGDGHIVSKGRNMVFENGSNTELKGSYIAHAEMHALMQIKNEKKQDLSDLVLYTSMEPCPMCFGAAMMIHIPRIVSASKDGFAGSTCLKDATNYLKGKNAKVSFILGDLQLFQICIQTAFELNRKHPKMISIIDKFRIDSDLGVRIAEYLCNQDYFQNSVDNNVYVGEIYDKVMKMKKIMR